MKPLFLLIIIAALAISALGQTQVEVPGGQKCSLTLAQSPEIRGLKLGMGVEEVLKHFPGRSNDEDVRHALASADKQFGVARFGVFPHQYEPATKFPGISHFSFEFLDNRLSTLSVNYDGPEWNSVDQFISKLSESLNLPGAMYWERSNLEALKTLKCAGFEVRAFIGGSGGNSNSVQVRNPVTDQIVRQRQTEAEEKARQNFKP